MRGPGTGLLVLGPGNRLGKRPRSGLPRWVPISLPRFVDRIIDATAPALGAIDRSALVERLEGTAVTLRAGDKTQEGHSRTGFLLAANLAARLFPQICLLGPDEVVERAIVEIALINPNGSVTLSALSTSPSLNYECRYDLAAEVAVFARGWNAYVDTPPDIEEQPTAPAALVAAVLGIAELFRTIFAEELGSRGRRHAQPGAINLVTLGEPTFNLPGLQGIDLKSVRLIGAGAIGQAAALTLAESGVTGTVAVVDHEQVVLSNLQRYVLTRDRDVGASKVELLRDRLRSSALTIVPYPVRWQATLVEGQVPTLVALDTPEDRITVQASLPGPIFNAWTQPADLGWSRHEAFGRDPCLACLYWPTHGQPGRHEQIAASFRQHPLRVLAYLVHQDIRVGMPLPPGGIPTLTGIPAPSESDRWMRVPIIDDIAALAGIDSVLLAGWRDRRLADLYQEGICGGALIQFDLGSVPQEVLVPLAHQSAFAGIMLATQALISAVPGLAEARPAAIEGRLDILSGLPQVLARPRLRTPGCLCADSAFLTVHGAKLNRTSGEGVPDAIHC